MFMNTFKGSKSINSHKLYYKSLLIPFTLTDDPKLSLLRNFFRQYFEELLVTIEQWHIQFSERHTNKLIISKQTYEELTNSVVSVIRSGVVPSAKSS